MPDYMARNYQQNLRAGGSPPRLTVKHVELHSNPISNLRESLYEKEEGKRTDDTG